MLDRYAADSAGGAMPFLEWVDTRYDRNAIMRDYVAGRGARLVMDRVLRRE
jgi:hypothetical protein